MTEPIEAWLIQQISDTWDCAVYDSPPLEQTAPPYAVLERLPDITEPNAGLLRKYQAWRYAIYGVFPLANLIGASVGEGKREKYQRLYDELHMQTSIPTNAEPIACVVRVESYEPNPEVALEHANAFVIKLEVSIRA